MDVRHIDIDLTSAKKSPSKQCIQVILVFDTLKLLSLLLHTVHTMTVMSALRQQRTYRHYPSRSRSVEISLFKGGQNEVMCNQINAFCTLSIYLFLISNIQNCTSSFRQLNTNQIELSLVYLGYFSVILVMSIYKNLQPVQLNRYDRYKHPSLTKENETGDLDPRVIKPTVSSHCVFWMCICDHMIGMRVGRES